MEDVSLSTLFLSDPDNFVFCSSPVQSQVGVAGEVRQIPDKGNLKVQHKVAYHLQSNLSASH